MSDGEIWTLARLVLGLLSGGVFGALLQRSGYCTMGALTDVFLFGSWRRSRVWMAAVAAALIGTQAAILVGLLPDVGPGAGISAPVIASSALGGLIFGIGMVLAGGCASRSIVRLASGSLKALFSLLLMAICAAAVSRGFRVWPAEVAVAGMGAHSLEKVMPMPLHWLAMALGGAVLVGAVSRQVRRGELREAGLGVALGSCCALAWLASTVGADGSSSMSSSLDFAVPTAELLLVLIADRPFGFAAAIVAGTLIGAFWAAVTGRTFVVETFTDRGDMLRHATGGVLMGVGGGVAMGCTIGHGLSGLAALSSASLVAVLGMVAGCRLGLFHLEGRTSGFLAALSPRSRCPRDDEEA